MQRDKKAIKREILDKFRTMSDHDDPVLPPGWVMKQFLSTPDFSEHALFKEAVRELASRGLVEPLNHSDLRIRLTEKGFCLIF